MPLLETINERERALFISLDPMILDYSTLKRRIRETQKVLEQQDFQHVDFQKMKQSVTQLEQQLSQKKVILNLFGLSSETITNIQSQSSGARLLRNAYVVRSDNLIADFPESKGDFALGYDIACCLIKPELLDSEAINQVANQIQQGLLTKQIWIIDATLAKPELEIQAIRTQICAQVSPVLEDEAFSVLTYVPECSDLVACLIQALEQVIPEKPETLLVRRLTAQWSAQTEAISALVSHQKATLEKAEEQVNKELTILTTSDQNSTDNQKLKDAIQKLKEDKQQFFAQVPQELKLSKVALLDKFSRKGVIYQIQTFAEELQPEIIDHRGAQYVQLQAPYTQGSGDINNDMLYLCYEHLSQWAISEWQHIYICYGDGGMSKLLEQVHSLSRSMPVTTIQLGQRHSPLPRFPNLLKDGVAGITCESLYKQTNPVGYLLRQLRSQWMGLSFLLIFAGTFLGGSASKREMMKSLFEPILNLKSSPVFLFLVLSIPLSIILLCLLHAFYSEKEGKLLEEADKLRKKLCKHYQEFAEVSADRLLQEFMAALKLEADRLDDDVSQIQEQLDRKINVVDPQIPFLEQKLGEIRKQKAALEKLCSKLQGLQRN